MINYQDIPIHLRCTNRHLIDPEYPGGIRFWHNAEVLADKDHTRSTAYHMPPRELSRNAKAMYNLMVEYGEYRNGAFAKKLGLTDTQVLAAINNMMAIYPVYETYRGNRVYYGILGVTDDRR